MEIENPSLEEITIYTKENCIYCEKVKELLKNERIKIVECDKYLNTVMDRDNFLYKMREKINYEYKTFPMVFYKGIFLGGYIQTKRWYENLLFDDEI